MTDRRQLLWGVLVWASLLALLLVMIYFGIGARE